MGKSRYTPEMEEWLKKNVPGNTRRKTYDEFRKTFGSDFDDVSIDNKITVLRIQTGNQHKWAEAEIDEARRMRESGLTWRQIGEQFGVTENAAKCMARGNGLCDEAGDPFTPEEDKWLLENVPGNRWKQIECEFEKTFGKHRTVNSLKSRCRSKYLRAFTNEGKTGGHPGDAPWCQKEDGSETTLGSGYTKIKVDGEWVPKQKLIYEERHGKLPDNMFVIFLNRDRNDFSEKNLFAVDRNIHAQMCSNGWYSEDPDITLAAIKLCELNRAIRTIHKGG